MLDSLTPVAVAQQAPLTPLDHAMPWVLLVLAVVALALGVWTEWRRWRS